MEEQLLSKIRTLTSKLALLSEGTGGVNDVEGSCMFRSPLAHYEREKAEIEALVTDLGIQDYLLVDEAATTVRLNLNKQALRDQGVLFFLSQKTFSDWIDQLSPFDAQSFFNSHPDSRTLIIGGLDSEHRGPALQLFSEVGGISPEPVFFEEQLKLIPSSTVVRQRVHVIPPNFTIEPRSFLLYNPSASESVSPIVKAAILTLAACLVQELRPDNIVTIRGRRRLEVPFFTANDFGRANVELLQILVNAVSWVYEERIDTRIKLISDRLSLDIRDGESLIGGLRKYLNAALIEAKELYGFVISEASDEFHKEKREIQVEVNKQLQAYGAKTRDLLSAILRDSLAGLFLVGFSIFASAKPDNVANLLKSPYVGLLFQGLSLYFVVSLVVQSAVTITDVIQSRGELHRYATATRNYLRPDEIRQHINNSLIRREVAFWVFFGIIVLIYLAIILFCWKFPELAILPEVSQP